MEHCVTDSIELYCSTPRSVTYRQHELQPERPPDNETNTELVSTLKSSACPLWAEEEEQQTWIMLMFITVRLLLQLE